MTDIVVNDSWGESVVMRLIDDLRRSEFGRQLIVNIADGLACSEIDILTLQNYFFEVEDAVRQGMGVEVAAAHVAFVGYAFAGAPKYHYRCPINDCGPGTLCTFVGLSKLQALIREADGLQDIIEDACSDDVMGDGALDEEDAVALASAVTLHGAKFGLRLQRSAGERPLPQWFTTIEDFSEFGVGWTATRADDRVAQDIRDLLALGHIGRGAQLYAFVSPPGWALKTSLRAARPLFWDAIDQFWFRHRLEQPSQHGWGRALDLRKPVHAPYVGASEMVAPGGMFETDFVCAYVGRLHTEPERERVWQSVLGGRSLDDLAGRVRDAVVGRSTC